MLSTAHAHFLKFFYYFILFYLFNYLLNYLFIYLFSKSRYGIIAEHVQRNVYISKDVKFSFKKRNKKK